MVIAFTTEDHNVWQILVERQLPVIKNKASSLFHDGWTQLGMPTDRIPDRETISQRLPNNWTLVLAEQQYMDDDLWFEHLAEKEWPVTDFIRDANNLGFTPLPDLFHDFFGHLAFLTNPTFLDLAQRFGHVHRSVDPATGKQIAHAWWHSIEFGLIRENGEKRLLGAGLISSSDEIQQMEQSEHQPFQFEQAATTEKATGDVHQSYFVVESLQQIRNGLERFIDQQDAAC